MSEAAQEFDVRIGGARAAGVPLRIHNPYDSQYVGSVARVDEEGVEQALVQAHALYRERKRWLPVEQRIRILTRAAELLEARSEGFALGAALEGGKPLTDSRMEVARSVDGLRNCAELPRNHAGREIPMGLNAASAGRLAMTHGEPIGVVVAFSAFNHPVNLIVHQVAPAIAAGCPVIIKPAEATPLSCFRLIDLLHEAGLPPGWVQPLMTTGHELSQKLVADGRVGFFSFIGSADVGWKLRASLAPGARCALEHGGVAPTILAEDADLDTALPLIAHAGLYHAGQVCVSTQRVYAPRARAGEVATRLAALASAMKLGDPAQLSTAIGPLIRPREVERVAQWVQEAVTGGAQLICGGHAVERQAYAATVLLEPPETARISRREVFGPVICVYGYEHIEDAIARANDVPYAFQSAVFTRSLDTAMQCYRGLDASTVLVNDHTAFRVDWMPFAGLRVSGLGVGGMPYTYREMQVEKQLILRSAER